MILGWDSDRRQPEAVTILALSALAMRDVGEAGLSGLLSRAAGAVYCGESGRLDDILAELDEHTRGEGARHTKRAAILGRVVVLAVMKTEATARAA